MREKNMKARGRNGIERSAFGRRERGKREQAMRARNENGRE